VREPRALRLGVVVLVVLVAVLAAAAVYLRLRRSAPAGDPGPALRDAAVTDVVAPVAPDAAAIEPATADAGVPAMAADAGAPAVARDAGRKAGSAAAPAEDKAAQAKKLLAQANEAISEGEFERALRAADGSLALRKTPRAYLARARALQRLDRVDDALAAVAAAERLAPKYATVYELRGRILWAVRRKDEAREQFARFLELEPEGARAQQIRKLLGEP
jgi:tetratricopeptide (TPR) repeat protein